MKRLIGSGLAAAALLAPTLAMAIVGQTSTSISAADGGNGNPIYFANQPDYSGVVTLIITNGTGPASVCTGALLANRVSILTAGHCVSQGAGTSVTAYFPAAGASPDSIVALDPTSAAVAISKIRVDPLYTGQTVDENDLAVLTLATPAPASATGYGLYTGDPLGQDYTIAGYGQTSSVGGSVGANLAPGLLRQGTNTFDFTFGDPLFQGYFEPGGPGAPGTAADGRVLLSDFDDGTAADDTSCTLAAAFGGGGPRFCDLGTGASEVGTAYGDSGAPEFIDGEIAAVSSFGLSLAGVAPDGRFGELDGAAPTEFQRVFILSVPEPATWAMMIVGLGLVGAFARRSQPTAA